MTATNRYNYQPDIKDLTCTPVEDKSSFYCCEYYSFEPCICKYIVVYDARTALFIAKGDL